MTIHPRKLRGVAIATVAAAAVLVLPAAAPARDTLGACGPDADLLAFSDALNKTTFDGFGVGGLSALALRGGGHARALVDNQGATAARFYDLDLDAHGELAPPTAGAVAECCRAADWHACPARSRSSRRLCSSTSASARRPAHEPGAAS